MASAKSDTKIADDAKKEMRAYKEGCGCGKRFMDFVRIDSPWSVTMSTIWPNPSCSGR